MNVNNLQSHSYNENTAISNQYIINSGRLGSVLPVVHVFYALHAHYTGVHIDSAQLSHVVNNLY